MCNAYQETVHRAANLDIKFSAIKSLHLHLTTAEKIPAVWVLLLEQLLAELVAVDGFFIIITFIHEILTMPSTP